MSQRQGIQHGSDGHRACEPHAAAGEDRAPVQTGRNGRPRRALHRHHLQHLVALVGFDDVELAELLDPGVTVVAYEAYQLGQQAAELLFSRMDGYRGPSRHRVVTTKLVVRGSGEIRPSEVAAAGA